VRPPPPQNPPQSRSCAHSFRPSHPTGYGYWQALNATHATWDWHTVVANKGPKDWTDSLTIVQNGRGH